MAETFTVTTSQGCEEILAGELRRMGLQRVVRERGAVRFMGPLRDGLRACLWSRVGSRVLLRLARFDAPAAEALYQGVAAIPWTDHLSPDETLRVDFAGRSRTIRDERFGALTTKDAIVDAIRARAGRRPDVARTAPDVLVNVHLRDGVATVSLDLSGESLHLRTPGRQTGAAPLKETLAATMLLVGDWPRRARDGQPMVDPLCGSGTIALEAAAIAHDLAPGLARTRWGFTSWLSRDDSVWAELVDEAAERRFAGAERPCAVYGSDVDGGAIALARANAAPFRFAGLSFERRALADLQQPPGPPGLLVTNPPFGERLDSVERAAALYRTLGDILRRRLLGWHALVLAPAGPLSKELGLRPRARHVVFNGPLECRLLDVAISPTAPRGLLPALRGTTAAPESSRGSGRPSTGRPR